MVDTSLLEVEGLQVTFRRGASFGRPKDRQSVRAVDGVSLAIPRGYTVGLVGESGSGKSTLGKALLQLVPISSGRIIYEGNDLTLLSRAGFTPYRRKMQMIFQDPYASLNPRMRVGQIIGEPLGLVGLRGQERSVRLRQLLEMVGLPQRLARRYPHEFSGGQRQRVGIARALAMEPEFIVCDEPVSALDVSIRAQILSLLVELKQTLGLTLLLIAHDMAAVNYAADRVAVMYLGKILELAGKDELYSHPLHPYTRALLSAVPLPDPVAERARQRIVLVGDIPSPANPPTGCRFHTRCPTATDRCRLEEPPLVAKRPGHLVACHYA